MRIQWLIIDGYNLLHHIDELSALARTDLLSARQRLVRLVEKTAHRMAPQTTIVFDGREAGRDEGLAFGPLEIYFSPANLSADTVIERLVCRYAEPETILVVTSDHAEHDTVSSAGAQTMSVPEFIAQCAQDARRPIARRTRPGEEPKLGDLFPDGL